MPELASIAKSFTRFFIPGLTFFCLGLLLPIYLWDSSLLVDFEVSASLVLFSALLFGYLLDSIKGYRWTFSLPAYLKQKATLTEDLGKIVKDESSNPDDLTAGLWLNDKETHERVFVERAEWVMILETAFSMIVGGVVLLGIVAFEALAKHSFFWKGTALAVVYFLISWLASRNGIDRMIAHDRKLLAAVAKQLEPKRRQGEQGGVVSNEAAPHRV